MVDKARENVENLGRLMGSFRAYIEFMHKTNPSTRSWSEFEDDGLNHLLNEAYEKGRNICYGRTRDDGEGIKVWPVADYDFFIDNATHHAIEYYFHAEIFEQGLVIGSYGVHAGKLWAYLLHHDNDNSKAFCDARVEGRKDYQMARERIRKLLRPKKGDWTSSDECLDEWYKITPVLHSSIAGRIENTLGPREQK